MPGSYQCQCLNGFHLASNKKNCTGDYVIIHKSNCMVCRIQILMSVLTKMEAVSRFVIILLVASNVHAQQVLH